MGAAFDGAIALRGTPQIDLRQNGTPGWGVPARRPLRSLARRDTSRAGLRAASRLVKLVSCSFQAIAEGRRLDARTDIIQRSRAKAYALSRAFDEICVAHGMQIKTSGAVPAGPVVLVSNHLGYIDPLVLASLVPCMPVAKRELGSWPLFGNVARSLQVALVERGNPYSGARTLRAALRALHAGISVLNFPEGTTTHGDTLLPFKRGIFGVARIAEVPVVPVMLRFEAPELAWVGDDPFLPHYLRMASRQTVTIDVKFGPALRPRRYVNPADLAGEAYAIVDHMLCGG